MDISVDNANAATAWVSEQDPATQRYYWWNPSTGERLLERPDGASEAAAWSAAVAPSGHTYYYTLAGERTWEKPAGFDATFQVHAHMVGVTGSSAALPPAGEPAALSTTAGPARNTMSAKIDDMLETLRWKGRPIISPARLRPWLHGQEGVLRAGSFDLRYGLHVACGSMVYGILFVPFVFALLQQTMMDNEALDPYSPDHQLTRRAWVGGSTFLGAVTLYCMLMFTVLDEDVWYVPHAATRRAIFGN